MYTQPDNKHGDLQVTASTSPFQTQITVKSVKQKLNCNYLVKNNREAYASRYNKVGTFIFVQSEHSIHGNMWQI